MDDKEEKVLSWKLGNKKAANTYVFLHRGASFFKLY